MTGGLPRVCWQPEKVSGCCRCGRRKARPAERDKRRTHRDVTHSLKMGPSRMKRFKEGAGIDGNAEDNEPLKCAGQRKKKSQNIYNRG